VRQHGLDRTIPDRIRVRQGTATTTRARHVAARRSCRPCSAA